jgi:hypothetical protein
MMLVEAHCTLRRLISHHKLVLGCVYKCRNGETLLHWSFVVGRWSNLKEAKHGVSLFAAG